MKLLAYGTIFCETEEKLNEVMAVLRPEGFEVALQTQTGGTLVKEVADGSEDKTA